MTIRTRRPSCARASLSLLLLAGVLCAACGDDEPERTAARPEPTTLEGTWVSGGWNLALVAKDGVLDSIGAKLHEVIVSGETNASLATSVGELFFVRCTQQASVRGCRNINAAKSQAMSDRVIGEFIEMKSHRWHPYL